ncbi:MAG: AcrB/AcrD/AcrF family protein [Acidobacteria bacterium]|nr:AcrB/AcrD/AcrF family protein [Acidobacteriota bacterium]MBI3470745.1 AcrB/AcrD/AcrF family protein [Candidatus Solibacter usitatus]
MILPQTYAATLCLLIFSMLCWGSWANTLKFAGKWRFELFYFDYAVGVMLAATLYAFTFGSLGFDGFQFSDDLMQTGKRNILYGLLGGTVFNLANMLLVAAISVAGLAVAFPVGIGLALVIGVVWNYAIKSEGNPVFLFGGAAIIVAAIIVDAMAYQKHARAKLEEQAKAGLLKTSAPRVPLKGIVLSIFSGVLMGSFFPLVELGKSYGVGMGPYAIGFAFAGGVLLSTFPFNLFFMNLPVQGDPVEVRDYFLLGGLKQHALGVLGGLLWYSGTMANFVAASAENQAQVGPAVSYAIGQGATMISVIWGLLVWKEFDGADMRVKTLLTLMFVLFLLGLGLVSVAPVFK